MSKQKKQDSEERLEGTDVGAGQEQDGMTDELMACKSSLDEAERSLALEAVKVAALEAEVSSLKDQYLRKLADYENFRKRMFREKEDAIQYANSQILSDLVTVVDNFDRAVQSSETSKDFRSLHDGVDMIRKSLLGLLEGKYGLVRFDSLGAVFDPNVHEAVMSEYGDCAQPIIVEEFVRGYKLRDRVLRSAKVKVRMPAPEAEAAGTEETSGTTNA
jgi:molecular chaperone GrpE